MPYTGESLPLICDIEFMLKNNNNDLSEFNNVSKKLIISFVIKKLNRYLL